jgi:hypothetical protein
MANDFNDFIDWVQFGDDWTVISPELQNNQGPSNQGLVTFTITHPLQLVKLTQGKRDNWRGNFQTGDSVIYTDHLPGPISIAFDPPIQGLRTQVQINEIPERGGDPIPFRATMSIFDSKERKLKTTSAKGLSDSSSDGSAVAIELFADAPVIKRVEINAKGTAPGPHDNDFAINRIDLKT